MLWVDYMVAGGGQFPVVYVIPVILAAWYSGKWPAVALASAVPVFRLLVFVIPFNHPEELGSLALTTALRGIVIVFLALWFARLAEFERELQREVKVLEGLLPICSFCKNIRNDAGNWERLEKFISRQSKAEFSHGICPTCAEKHYPGLT